jgi:hypothetical protein
MAIFWMEMIRIAVMRKITPFMLEFIFILFSPENWRVPNVMDDISLQLH